MRLLRIISLFYLKLVINIKFKTLLLKIIHLLVSLKNPFILIFRHFSFILLWFPLLIMHSFFPSIEKLCYFFWCFCLYLYLIMINKVEIYVLSEQVEFLAKLTDTSLKQGYFLRCPDFYNLKIVIFIVRIYWEKYGIS